MKKTFIMSILAGFLMLACSDGGTISNENPTPETPDTGDKPGTNPDKPGTNPDKPGTNPDNPTKPPKSDVPDEDGDTISDADEGRDENVDTDGDGTPDYLDEDSDNDTIPDSVEAINGGDPGNLPYTALGCEVPAFRTLDADCNGIPDKDEVKFDSNGVPSDIDNDTIPDFADEDNDGDNIGDAEEIKGSASEHDQDVSGMDCDNDKTPDPFGTPENPIDCDQDGIPDYNSPDSDGDTVGDFFEGTADSNKDGFYDRYSQDSDGDTIPDKDERGKGENPADTDDDGLYDFQDLDSDNDGLLDQHEVYCDSLQLHSSVVADADGDTYSDLAEYATAASNGKSPKDYICSADKNVKEFVTFYFELPRGGNSSDQKLLFEPSITQADIVLNIDTTGTMQTAIENLQQFFSKIVVSETRKRVPESQFGLSIFRDLDAEPAWQLWKAISPDDDAFNSKLGEVKSKNDSTDVPEAGYEALYEIATGDVSKNSKAYNVVAKPEGIGGVGFRTGSLPIILHVTDANSNEKGHSAAQAFEALNKIGARVIQLGTPITPSAADALKAEGIKMAKNTNAVVPVCAYQYDNGKWACGENKCCTNEAYKASPVGEDPDSDGNCVLSIQPHFDLSREFEDASGNYVNNLAYKTVLAIEALVKYGTYNVSTRVIGVPFTDEERFSDDKPDTSCFIDKIEALSYTPPDNEIVRNCLKNIPTQPTKFNDSAYDNGFSHFAVGTALASGARSQLQFNVVAKNDNCVKPSVEARSYKATIQVYDPVTELVFAQHEVAIIVPGEALEQIN